MADIKSMKLYTHAERIENELAELGHAPGNLLNDFYRAVDHHFQSGKLNGLRICARLLE
jgi:hypothetical protein